MPEEKQRELVDALLSIAEELQVWIMIGMLRTGPGEARAAILETAAQLDTGTMPAGNPERAAALAARRVSGFTVTAPKGAEIPQAEIHAELTAADRVARAGHDYGNIFLVRGAELDYALVAPGTPSCPPLFDPLRQSPATGPA